MEYIVKLKMEKTDNYTHILKYTSLFGGVQGLSILVGVVRNKLVAMILGPDGIGIVSLFNSIIKLVSDSSNLGLSMSAVKKISEIYDRGDTIKLNHSISVIRVWGLLTALIGMFLCIALSSILSKWAFGNDSHTLHLILLSPIVAMLAITGGELAILKGTRHLRQLAVMPIINVIGALITSVPLYYYFGISGIVPSLLFIGVIQMFLAIFYSYRIFPLDISFEKSLYCDGFDMVRIGIAFVIAGILNSGADFIVRSYINKIGTLESVGLFNSGFMMTMTYAGMVFSAMETDYFPRLSAISNDKFKQNVTINQQIEVSLLIISPMLVFFMIFLPILLPLLYSGKFLPVLGMMQVTVLAMYMRAIKLPIAYLPLAKGDSAMFLLMESIYDIVLVLLVCFMYCHYGLLGSGIAIVFTSIFDFFMLTITMYFKYGYTISKNVLCYMLYLLPIGVLAYSITFVDNKYVYWSFGTLFILFNCVVSLYVLHSKTHLWSSLTKRFIKNNTLPSDIRENGSSDK